MSVLLAQNEMRLASREVSQAVFENQKTDARFRKASARREADVVTNRA